MLPKDCCDILSKGLKQQYTDPGSSGYELGCVLFKDDKLRTGTDSHDVLGLGSAGLYGEQVDLPLMN